MLLEQYVAISDYAKREGNDLNLRAGNLVDVIEKNDHGTYFGEETENNSHETVCSTTLWCFYYFPLSVT